MWIMGGIEENSFYFLIKAKSNTIKCIVYGKHENQTHSTDIKCMLLQARFSISVHNLTRFSKLLSEPLIPANDE